MPEELLDFVKKCGKYFNSRRQEEESLACSSDTWKNLERERERVDLSAAQVTLLIVQLSTPCFHLCLGCC